MPQENNNDNGQLVIMEDIIGKTLYDFATFNGSANWHLIIDSSSKTIEFVAQEGIKTKQHLEKPIKRQITVPFDGQLIKYKNHEKKQQLSYNNGTLYLDGQLVFQNFQCVCKIVKNPRRGNFSVFMPNISCNHCNVLFNSMPPNSISYCTEPGCDESVCANCAKKSMCAKELWKQFNQYCFTHFREHGLKCDQPFNFIFDYDHTKKDLKIYYSSIDQKFTIPVEKIDFATAQRVTYEKDDFCYRYVIYHVHFKNGFVLPLYNVIFSSLHDFANEFDRLKQICSLKNEQNMRLFKRFPYSWVNNFHTLFKSLKDDENYFFIGINSDSTNPHDSEIDVAEEEQKTEQSIKQYEECIREVDSSGDSSIHKTRVLPDLVITRLPLFHEVPTIEFSNGWKIQMSNPDCMICPSHPLNQITAFHPSHRKDEEEQKIVCKFDSESFCTPDQSIRWDHLNQDLYYQGQKIVQNDAFVSDA